MSKESKRREKQYEYSLHLIQAVTCGIESDLGFATSGPVDEGDTSDRLPPWDPEILLYYNLADGETREALKELSKLIGRLLSRGSAN